MATSGIHHIAITVNDFERSKAFYGRLFERLGVPVAFEATGAPHRDPQGRIIVFGGPKFLFGVWEASPEHRGASFEPYSVGLHHAAFAATSREEVDAVHRALAEDGVEILDAPAEYDYVPGYYAVFFRDPNGMKLEVVHVP